MRNSMNLSKLSINWLINEIGSLRMQLYRWPISPITKGWLNMLFRISIMGSRGKDRPLYQLGAKPRNGAIGHLKHHIWCCRTCLPSSVVWWGFRSSWFPCLQQYPWQGLFWKTDCLSRSLYPKEQNNRWSTTGRSTWTESPRIRRAEVNPHWSCMTCKTVQNDPAQACTKRKPLPNQPDSGLPGRETTWRPWPKERIMLSSAGPEENS